MRELRHRDNRYVVSCRRRGIVTSPNGIEAILSLGKLIVRVMRRDQRYEVLVWNRDAFPFGLPKYSEEVPTRADGERRVEQLARELEIGTWAPDE